jgi:hypothetical protein
MGLGVWGRAFEFEILCALTLPLKAAGPSLSRKR